MVLKVSGCVLTRYGENCRHTMTDMKEEVVILTDPYKRRCSRPQRASPGTTRVGEEAEEARGKCGQGPILGFPWEGVGLGLAALSSFSGVWSIAAASSCLEPDPGVSSAGGYWP